MLFWADYFLRWWRLPIEERACRKTDLGGGDYYLRNSGLAPSSANSFNEISISSHYTSFLNPAHPKVTEYIYTGFNGFKSTYFQYTVHMYIEG